jgi:hypothetical protein
MDPGIAGEQPRTRTNVRVGQLQLTAGLDPLLTGLTDGDVPSVAMRFELRFGMSTTM